MERANALTELETILENTTTEATGWHKADERWRGVFIDLRLRLVKALTLLREPTATPWQPIETAPERRPVWVTWVNALGKRRITKAVFFPAGELAMDDAPDEMIDEEGNNAESGWFEDREAGEPSYWALNEQLTHWMPLPSPPSLGETPAPAREKTEVCECGHGSEFHVSGKGRCACVADDGQWQCTCDSFTPRTRPVSLPAQAPQTEEQKDKDHGTSLLRVDPLASPPTTEALPEKGWEDVDGENADYVNRITAIVRESDRVFTKVGGGSRHWVRDVFLPLLNRSGLYIATEETCQHCGEDIRKDNDGDWIDRETHTICDTPEAGKHAPRFVSGMASSEQHSEERAGAQRHLTTLTGEPQPPQSEDEIVAEIVVKDGRVEHRKPAEPQPPQVTVEQAKATVMDFVGDAHLRYEVVERAVDALILAVQQSSRQGEKK